MQFKSMILVAIFAIGGASGSAMADDSFATLNGLTVPAMSADDLAEVVGAFDYIKNSRANSRSPLWTEDLKIAEAADGNEQNLGVDIAEDRGRTPIQHNESPF